jgi:hypothetical protein
MTANKLPMAEYLNPLQMVLEEGAAAKLVHMTRISFERDPRFIIISLDIRNAFNAMRRAKLLERLAAIPTLAHMSDFVHATLNGKSSLVMGGDLLLDPQGNEVLSSRRRGLSKAIHCLRLSLLSPFTKSLWHSTQQWQRAMAWGLELGLALMTSLLLASLRWCCRQWRLSGLRFWLTWTSRYTLEASARLWWLLNRRLLRML